MKQYYLKVAMFIIALTISIDISAYSFDADGIGYNIISASNLTVEVCFLISDENSTVVIPETVSSDGNNYTVIGIGAYAFDHETFYYKKELSSIDLPSTIEFIGNCAFRNCRSLKTIDLKKCKKIGDNSFEGCRFQSLIIPKTIEYIGKNCFQNSSLSELIVLASNPPYIMDNLGLWTSTEILVPQKNVFETQWSSFIKSPLVEMLTPNSYTFVYSGKAPEVLWTNNLKAYAMELEEPSKTKINAGSYSASIKANFYKNGELAFPVEFPYEYTISKVPLTVKANNASREYGEENPDFSFVYSGFVNGEDESAVTVEPSMSTTAISSSNVGEYPISINGGEAKNYDFIYEPAVLTVTKAPLSAKVNDTNKVYGMQNPVFSIEYHGLKNNEEVPAWFLEPVFQTEATQNSGVGQYEVKVVYGMPINYNLGGITQGILNVTPAQLTIKANDATRQYYCEEPNFSFTCSGFVNDENESVLSVIPTISSSATKSSNVGEYEIKVSGSSSPNYSISYVNGTLTITPRTLFVSVGNYERVYDEDNPSFKVKYDGFVENEDEGVLNAKPTAITVATKTSDVGIYPINVEGGSADNYKFSYISGTLTINKAEQTLSWEQDLGELGVGDQVLLNAKASSGLPITYTINNDSVAEIYWAGSKCYLDCKTKGEVQIMAVQEGNKNYYSSERIRRSVVVGDASAINETDALTVKVHRTSFGITVSGASIGDMIQIYSSDGIMHTSVAVKEKTIDIPLKEHQVYIIKVGTKIVKLFY